MARSKLTSKNTKSGDENDIKILLATTLISILLAAFLLNMLIQPVAAISSDETVVPEEQKPDIVRVKEKVGEKILWTPILIVTSPPRGYAKGSIQTTAKASFKLGAFKWESSGTWEWGVEDVTNGTITLLCRPAMWEMYHVYDKDRYTGAIWRDYGYHAKIKQFLTGHPYIDLDKQDDYRKVRHERKYMDYWTLWVDVTYKNQDDWVDTRGTTSTGTLKVGKHDAFGGEIDIKVKVRNYVSTGILRFDFTCSSDYYVLYKFPPGHYWDIDYLGPTKKKVWWWWKKTGPPIVAFVLRE